MSKITPAQKAQNQAIERDETISVMSSGTILSQKLGKKLQSLEVVDQQNSQKKDLPKELDKAQNKKSTRGKKYIKAQKVIKKGELVDADSAIKTIKEVAYAKFSETLELKINVQEIGLKGSVKMPFFTGKQARVVIADDTIVAQLEKGNIEFDILLTSPAFMPKLVKFAKLLGPKGLMPNPKTGTIGQDPQALLKNFSSDIVRFKTESKAPIIHMAVGKLVDPKDNLVANIQTILDTIGRAHIQSVYVKSSMSPSIAIKF